MTIDLFNVLLQKPRLIVMDNDHLTTHMRTGGGVYFLHGLLILRYTVAGSLKVVQLCTYELPRHKNETSPEESFKLS